MFGYIYKTTNNVNGKIYIGQHRTNAINKKYMGSGTLLKRAFDKYGIDNFSNDIIDYADNQEDLDNLEIKYIKLYNSRDLNIGYNIVIGGSGGNIINQLPPEQYEAVINKMRINNKGSNNPNYGNGQKISGDRNPAKRLDVRKKISEAVTGELNGNYGRRYKLPDKAKHYEKCIDCGEQFLTQAGNRLRCDVCKICYLIQQNLNPRPRKETDHDGQCFLCGETFAMKTKTSKLCNRCLKTTRKIPR